MTDTCNPPQQADRKGFARAVLYAGNCLADPAVLEVYAAMVNRRQRIFLAALKDTLHAPHLFNLQTDAYTGKTGQPIRVQAMDQFIIIRLEFSLFSGTGRLLETGQAIRESNGFNWEYRAQASNSQYEDSTVVIKAMDCSPVFYPPVKTN